jgi:DnaK suppressor protein
MATEFESVRRKLLQQKQELLARAAKVRANITRSSGPLEKDFAEQVVQMENDAVLAGISEATAAELAQINRALSQLDHGTYGLCSQCGQPISARRLQALPYSDRCITCAEAAG